MKRLYLTFPQAMRYARVDAWRVVKWMADGTVDWAFNEEGVVTIAVESLQQLAGPEARTSVLREARAL